MTLLEEIQSRPTPPTPRRASAIRRRAGVSQQRLATELGVHRVTVARWELGERRPSGNLLQAYVDLLDQLEAAL